MPNKKASPTAQPIVDLTSSLWLDDHVPEEDRGFFSGVLAQCSLPHKKPDGYAWRRYNGDLIFDVKSGWSKTADQPQLLGVPYGSMPRLVLSYLNTEVIRNLHDDKCQNPNVVHVGKNLSAFLNELGISRQGRSITSLKEQMNRLFQAEITITKVTDDAMSWKDIRVSDGGTVFWKEVTSPETALWHTEIELTDRFVGMIASNPYPIDWRVLNVLKKSPFSLDVYLWLTHRVSYLKAPVTIKLTTLQKQLGCEYGEVKKFKYALAKQLKQLSVMWPELHYRLTADSLRLSPCPTMISPTAFK